MKRTILSAAIALAMVAGIAQADGGGYAPGYADYSGLGGAASASSSSISGTTVVNNGSTYGSQVSSGSAWNTTSAGASATPTGYGPLSGLDVTAHTASEGATTSKISGRGTGQSQNISLQGGLANANAGGSVFEADYTSVGGKKYCGPPTPRISSSAVGGGSVGIESQSGAASGAITQNTGDGIAIQKSGAGAENETTGSVSVFAHTHPGANHLKVTTAVESNGENYAYGKGMASDAFGASGGISAQMGGGEASAGGMVGLKQTEMQYGQGFQIGPFTLPGRRQTVTTDWQAGLAGANSEVHIGSLSAAGGVNNFYASTGANTYGDASGTGDIKANFTDDGVNQETWANSDTYVHAVSGAETFGTGGAITKVDPTVADGMGFAKGAFKGSNGIQGSYSD